ncbi:MAG TPA: glucose-1-phosphate thymidylyltransferase [Archaeoglobaceae archaeon]|nr:glucose-1-phosphate thymidylyltransferase [Archaeoglobaceae archaeon]
MQAVVLAAGEGTRMRPLTYTRPKVMLPVLNKPILEHLFNELKSAGIEDIVCVVGYRDDRVREYFKDGRDWGIRVRYVTQRKQLGTADALKSSSYLLEDEFLMLNGDSIISRKDIKKIARSKRMAVGVVKVENPEDFGVVEIKKGNFVRIIEKPEKPPSNLINAGIYHFHRDIIRYVKRTPISVRGEYEITDSIQLLLQDGYKLKAKEIDTWIDVGYPWDLLNASERILNSTAGNRVDGEVEEGAVLKGNVVVGEGTVIRSGSYIIGPAIIGKDCDIGPNCFIRPCTTIGDGCRVGNGVEIKNSIIMSNTKIPHLNYVGDSIIGENCNIGAGTSIANLRLDKKEIFVSVKGKIVNTHRKKFGAVVGDNVMTGINVSINVGTMIGNNVFIGPACRVEGYIEPGSMVF